MINYSNSKIYFIKRRDTDEIVWCGGTISSINRRYYNHISNKDDLLNKKVARMNLNWSDLKIEVVKDYNTCQDRKRLRFAAETAYCYFIRNNPGVFHNFLDNIEYYIE